MHKSFSVCIFLENYVCVCSMCEWCVWKLNSLRIITAIIRRKIAHDDKEKGKEEEILKLYES